MIPSVNLPQMDKNLNNTFQCDQILSSQTTHWIGFGGGGEDIIGVFPRTRHSSEPALQKNNTSEDVKLHMLGWFIWMRSFWDQMSSDVVVFPSCNVLIWHSCIFSYWPLQETLRPAGARWHQKLFLTFCFYLLCKYYACSF